MSFFEEANIAACTQQLCFAVLTFKNRRFFYYTFYLKMKGNGTKGKGQTKKASKTYCQNYAAIQDTV